MAVSASLNVQWRTNSRRSVGGSNSAAIWASLSCCRRISRVSPEVKTQPIRVRESTSVLRRVPKMRQTVAFMAPPSTRSCYPWRISMARRQSVLSLSAYATKIGRSLVPAVEEDEARGGRLSRGAGARLYPMRRRR
jgi:ribosome-binding protein aMBF1 (putative translation factor)